MRRIASFVLLGACTAAGPLAAQPVAITNATIHPVSGPRIERGTIVLDGGRIVAVGSDVAIPANARRIDGTGKVVTPGMVPTLAQMRTALDTALAGKP